MLDNKELELYQMIWGLNWDCVRQLELYQMIQDLNSIRQQETGTVHM